MRADLYALGRVLSELDPGPPWKELADPLLALDPAARPASAAVLWESWRVPPPAVSRSRIQGVAGKIGRRSLIPAALESRPAIIARAPPRRGLLAARRMPAGRSRLCRGPETDGRIPPGGGRTLPQPQGLGLGRRRRRGGRPGIGVFLGPRHRAPGSRRRAPRPGGNPRVTPARPAAMPAANPAISGNWEPTWRRMAERREDG